LAALESACHERVEVAHILGQVAEERLVVTKIE